MSTTVPHLTAPELDQMLRGPEPPVLLDVRRPDEHAWAHIEGAILIPLPELEGRLDELDPSRPHVVYCHVGVRSISGAVVLQRAGFEQVWSLIGGIEAWSRQVDPKVPRT